ncbi:MAG: sigma 54-dependent Fis family transcriptional regulator [Archangiaceae bacterium]|nr:sigma 54-dependent Fis family transcriptional regulator [Archangiaceae bacterium]
MSDTPETWTLSPGPVGGGRPTVEPLKLLVLDGADAGKQLTVTQGTVLVGTHAECALVLTDPSVSRRHASLELLPGRVRVRDLESKNGTQYLGSSIRELEVPVGATVELGRTRLALLPLLTGHEPVTERSELEGLLGRSVEMRRLFSQLAVLAKVDAPVLIWGETGVGKEAVARALHQSSKRRAARFVTVDCAALSSELASSTLFGHVRGAFTGATRDAPGALLLAAGGTLFLDEVGELPLELQPMLLRALEQKRFTALGADAPQHSDFRILASTRHDLARLVKTDRFRSDLYYRLAGVVLTVPALRERQDDIALLAHRFAAEGGATEPLAPAVIGVLAARRWPGNVRELKHEVERILTLGEAAALPEAHADEARDDFHQARARALKAFEKSYLEALLARHGSPTEAAKEAGIVRSYLYKLLEAHGLKR